MFNKKQYIDMYLFNKRDVFVWSMLNYERFFVKWMFKECNGGYNKGKNNECF